MAFKFGQVLTEEERKRLAERNAQYAERNARYAQRREEIKRLTDKNLVAAAKYFMSRMEGPEHLEPEELGYDATFYYVILPEVLKRMDERADDDARREIEKIRSA